MAPFRERDAHRPLTLSLGQNEFRRVLNPQIGDVQTLLEVAAAQFLVLWHRSLGTVAFWLPHKKCISMRFKYYLLVLTLQ